MRTQSFMAFLRLLVIMSVTAVALNAPAHTAASEMTLFSGGFKDSTNAIQWAERFGRFDGDQATITPISGVCTTPEPGCTPKPTDIAHAEAQHIGFVGADFTYEYAGLSLRRAYHDYIRV